MIKRDLEKLATALSPSNSDILLRKLENCWTCSPKEMTFPCKKSKKHILVNPMTQKNYSVLLMSDFRVQYCSYNIYMALVHNNMFVPHILRNGEGEESNSVSHLTL